MPIVPFALLCFFLFAMIVLGMVSYFVRWIKKDGAQREREKANPQKYMRR